LHDEPPTVVFMDGSAQIDGWFPGVLGRCRFEAADDPIVKS
jgi:hypothetical protein